jgi:hypothetical protein
MLGEDNWRAEFEEWRRKQEARDEDELGDGKWDELHDDEVASND